MNAHYVIIFGIWYCGGVFGPYTCRMCHEEQTGGRRRRHTKFMASLLAVTLWWWWKRKFFFVFFSSKIKQKRPIWKYKKKKCYFFLSCWKLKVDIRTYQRQNGKERRRSKKDENLLAEGNRLRVLSSCILEGKYIIHGAIVLLLLLLFAHTDARTWI